MVKEQHANNNAKIKDSDSLLGGGLNEYIISSDITGLRIKSNQNCITTDLLICEMNTLS